MLCNFLVVQVNVETLTRIGCMIGVKLVSCGTVHVFQNSDFEHFGCARVNTKSNAVNIAEMISYEDDGMIKAKE